MGFIYCTKENDVPKTSDCGNISTKVRPAVNT